MEALTKKTRHASAHAALCTAAGLSTEDTAISSALNRAWHFTKKAESILCKKDEQASIASQVATITELAVLSCDVLHIHVVYEAHTRAMSVEVYPAHTIYRGHQAPMFRSRVSLKRDDPLEQLKDLEDKLIDLIADAKDNAMGAC